MVGLTRNSLAYRMCQNWREGDMVIYNKHTLNAPSNAEDRRRAGIPDIPRRHVG
jgi:hypothetical protein